MYYFYSCKLLLAMDYDGESNSRRGFEQEIRLLYNERTTKPEWTRKRISKVISHIEEYEASPRLNVRGNNEYNNQYFYANHYEVMQVSGQKYLVFKRKSTGDPIIKILPSEEYYDALLEIHKRTAHGGRDKMLHILKRNCQYFIPKPVVVIFVKQCVKCQNRRFGRSKSRIPAGCAVNSIEF
ncbi:uncharacterized protein LOC114362954 [Ostrinia furnacalis]|uniref:uncharacterized protein LOC114362954 n=1 Tax=Ostrinia furnacalis TaxID=93504 RepID=UPI00103A2B3A|nr:uncharacterized protein LOC114362954 [Ostrinia furnacalis]